MPVVKSLPSNARDIRDLGSIPGLGRSPEGKAWQPIPVFLSEEPHGQKTLMGYNPWCGKESDMIETT